jgi:hypothetical protein
MVLFNIAMMLNHTMVGVVFVIPKLIVVKRAFVGRQVANLGDPKSLIQYNYWRLQGQILHQNGVGVVTIAITDFMHHHPLLVFSKLPMFMFLEKRIV